MPTHFEQSLQEDLDRICAKVQSMAALDERALRDTLKALQEGNRQLAYTVILRDQRVDEMEREIDQLCLEFLLRQQPVAGPLRLAYATIRINLELERIGDYAESIARQVLKVIGLKVAVPVNRFIEIADLSIPMLHDAVRAFVQRDAGLARRTMRIEEDVDSLRNKIDAELVHWRQENRISLEALTPLMTIARRFERVSDQAKNICQEVLYACTGEYLKHRGEDVFRWLFIDQHNSSLSIMAEAIGNSLNLPKFTFSSAGLDARPIDERTSSFLKEKGLVLTHPPHGIGEIDLNQFQIVVALGPGVQKALPPSPRKTVYFEWVIDDPSKFGGAPDQVRGAYEKACESLRSHILDLAEAILGDNSK